MSTAMQQATVRCRDIAWPRGRLELSRRVHVVGILNVTPDSFSDGGRFPSAGAAADAALAMVADGADVVDVGGESTRPGSSGVDAAEEKRRVVPVIEAIRRASPVPVSVDTRKAEVARAAVDAGADIVNDVSALRDDPLMGSVCAAAAIPVVLMHMKGTPRTMQQSPAYDDVIAEVRAFLADAAARAERAGISPSRIIVDPGIGFGKRVEDNLALVAGLDGLTSLGFPVMVAASRKSFIGRVLGGDEPLGTADREEGTLAVTVVAVMNGARLVRVHDVRANVRAVRMAEALLASKERP